VKLGLARMGRAAGIALAAVAAVPNAQAQEVERLPRRAVSIADLPSAQTVGGPLFERTKTALAAADKGGPAAFAPFLAPGARLTLRWFEGVELKTADFTAATIRAAATACLGPVPYDEAKNWVQLSWVCRVDSESPLAPYLHFRDSPELALTVWYERGRIKEIDAMEPLTILGGRRFTMDAYEKLKSRP